MSSKRSVRLAFVLMVCALAAGCTVVPLTGRRQLSLIPDSQLNAMSLTAYQETVGAATLSQNAAQVAAVREVGQRLAEATEKYLKANGFSTESYAWEFNVIVEDETVNAWCMPGGKVAVYTGILPITQNETGLAVVMGHEIAHAVARHGNERMSRELGIQAGGAVLSKVLQQKSEFAQGVFLASYGLASKGFVVLPHGRNQESEADRIGLTLMAMAGYDPAEAIPFWQRMSAAGGGGQLEFLSTHPAPTTRIDNIRKFLPEAASHATPR